MTCLRSYGRALARRAGCIALGAAVLATSARVAAGPCPNVTIKVDNDAPGSGYSETKVFNWASRSTGACSGTYRYLSHDKKEAPNNDGTRTGKAIWTPKITVSGTYEVTISYRATTNRTDDADYFVYDDNGGKTHKVIDQAHSGDCTYVKLGGFYCKAGGDCRVELDGTDDNKSDAADVTSFKLVNCDDPPPPGVCAGIANKAGYEVCEETATGCAGVFDNGSGCKAYCAAAGMICKASFGGEPGCQKEPNNPLPCEPASGHQSDWCECELPPGGMGGGGAASTGGAGGTVGAGGAGGDAATTSTGSSGVGGGATGGATSTGGVGDGGSPGSAPGLSGGCGCRLASTGDQHAAWLLLLLVGLACRVQPRTWSRATRDRRRRQE